MWTFLSLFSFTGSYCFTSKIVWQDLVTEKTNCSTLKLLQKCNSWRTPLKLCPLTLLPNYKVSDGWMFHNWSTFHVKSASCALCVFRLLNWQVDSLSLEPLEIWSIWGLYVNAGDFKIRLTRSRISWHRGKLLPPKMSDQVHFF